MNSHPFDRLSPDLVIDAVESTGVVSDARILALNSYENRVYQVGIEGGEPLVVKFYRPGRWTREQILEEHAFTHELADLEIPAVPPLRDDDGETLHEHAGFLFAVFARRGGRSPDLESADNLRVLGRFLGRLHKVGELRPFAYRRRLTIDDFAEASATFLLDRGFIPPDLRAAYDSLSQDLIRGLRRIEARHEGLRELRIHGDCHMGNVLWRDGTPHFVDFDDTMSGPAIQDLWMLLAGSRAEMAEQMTHLLEGYTQFSDFDARELALIEPLRALRMIHYAAWLARRWQDPAFPRAFPWFEEPRYWENHILTLREQLGALAEGPLEL